MASSLALLLSIACSPLAEPDRSAGRMLEQSSATAAQAANAVQGTRDFAKGYVGSEVCAPCHAPEFKLWQASLHSHMEQPATAATVVGDFTPEGTVLAAEMSGRRMVMRRQGDAFLIEAPDESGNPRVYPIERTIGNRYRQRYLTRLPDGSWHALPVQWLLADQRFTEPMHLASTAPRSGNYWLDDAWQWQLKCAGCHATGLDLGWDAGKKTYATRWRELAIGCESCHGRGAEHVLARGGTANILCPSKLSRDQQLDVCGQCHSRGSAGSDHGAPPGLPGKLGYPFGMVPGARLADRWQQATPASSPADFWPDGSSRNHHQQLIDFRASRMLKKGGDRAPHCTTCHEPHEANALKLPVENNALCVSCHEQFADAARLAAHTGHGSNPEANAGARCIGCHMPRIVQHAGSVKLHSHTFSSPDPRRARETQTPDACLLCHEDRDSAWAEASAAQIGRH
ncbi:MAG: cytochrome c3 family protein [Planctomycetota bacterium]